MQWTFAGADGAAFIAQAKAAPGWYWVRRPLNVGPRAYDPGVMVVLPIYAGAARFSSPLADLPELSAEALACFDADRGEALGTWFAGPVAPGGLECSLAVHDDGSARGSALVGGWCWCRTEGPLAHVDDDGIGPIFVQQRGTGEPWVWPASSPDGVALDVPELGFSEPLVSDAGIIDQHGEYGRRVAHFFGPIPLPRS